MCFTLCFVQCSTVAHGPAGQAMAGPVFGESFLFFSTEASKCCITYSSKRFTVDWPLEHIVHTDIQNVLEVVCSSWVIPGLVNLMTTYNGTGTVFCLARLLFCFCII